MVKPSLFFFFFLKHPRRASYGTHKTSLLMVLMKIRTKRQPPDPKYRSSRENPTWVQGSFSTSLENSSAPTRDAPSSIVTCRYKMVRRLK